MHCNQLESDILDKIIYRGEGNSSIVIAVKTNAKVIRLLKKDGKIMRSSQDYHLAQHPMQSIKFIHLIVKPLATPFLRGTPQLIHLRSEFINRLSEKVDAQRPIHRLDKTLHLDDQYALIMDDLCTLPTRWLRQLQQGSLCGPIISIEIKPKQGFLPNYRTVMKSSLNDQIAGNVKNCCQFGSVQFLKLARGRIDQKSDYCPINLFSGCPVKMKSALKDLVLNPQNNFKVFKDLTMAYDESCQTKLSTVLEEFFTKKEIRSAHSVAVVDDSPICNASFEDRLIDLLIQSLLNHHHDRKDSNELGKSNFEDENNFIKSDNCSQHLYKANCKRCDTLNTNPTKTNEPELKPHSLPKSCVLFSVLRAQKLDTIGPYVALYMLEWLLENSKSSGSNNDVLGELSKPQLPVGFGSIHQLSHETKEQYYFRKVWEFLVSLTAKDCSIIVTLRRISSIGYESIVNRQPSLKNHLLKDHVSGEYYLYSVGIADLDQKMPLKIPRICDNLNLILKTKRDIT